MLDFSRVGKNIFNIFEDIADLNLFFLRLQAETGITLYEHESINVFGKKFSKSINKTYLISQKGIGNKEQLMFRPFYLLPFLI